MKPIVKWQYEKIEDNFGLLEEHLADPDCPCHSDGENCARKHLKRIEAYCQETIILMVRDKGTPVVEINKLDQLGNEARQFREAEEDHLCGKKVPEKEFVTISWASNGRKYFETLLVGSCGVSARAKDVRIAVIGGLKESAAIKIAGSCATGSCKFKVKAVETTEATTSSISDLAKVINEVQQRARSEGPAISNKTFAQGTSGALRENRRQCSDGRFIMAEICQIASQRYRYLEDFFLSGTDLFMADPVAPPTEKERAIDKALAQLEEGIQGVLESDKYREYLQTLGKFHNYSLGNLILIMFQNPEATRVAGFNTWKDLDRNVKKGEKGLMILAPCFAPKGKKEPEPETEDEDEDEDEGEDKPSVRVVRTPVYFKVVYVFDVSQTEGRPLPEVEVPVVQGEDSKPLFDLGLQYCVKNGIKILDKPSISISPETMGYYTPKDRQIWIRPDVPQNQQTKTLFHEIAHSRAADKFGAGAEVLAESVAYAVCNHFGFDTGVRSFPYVAVWAKDVKLLKQNLDRIRTVTSDIIGEVEVLAKMQDPELRDWGSVGVGILTGVAAGIAQHYALKHLSNSTQKGKLEEWHTEGLACLVCGRPVPPRSIPEIWTEHHMKYEHPDYVKFLSENRLPWVAGLVVVGEDYPLRKQALQKLKPYVIIEVHDDGDLTILHDGKEWIVSTEGKAYKNYKLNDAAILAMKLLTQEIRKRLPPLRSTEFQEDPIVQVKFFTPWTNWTWFATEFDGEDEFFGLIQGDYNKMGYFSLRELESVTGPYGLKIERDLNFKPKPLSEVRGLIEAGKVADMVLKNSDLDLEEIAEDSVPAPLGTKEIPKLIEVYKTTIVKHYRAKTAFHKDSFRILKPNKYTLIWLGCLKGDQWKGKVCSDNQSLHKTIVKKTAAGMREVEKLKKSGIQVKYFTQEGVVPRAEDDIMIEIKTALDKAQPVG